MFVPPQWVFPWYEIKRALKLDSNISSFIRRTSGVLGNSYPVRSRSTINFNAHATASVKNRSIAKCKV